MLDIKKVRMRWNHIDIKLFTFLNCQLYADKGFEAVRIFILEKKLEAYKSKEATKNSSVLIPLDMLDHM